MIREKAELLPEFKITPYVIPTTGTISAQAHLNPETSRPATSTWSMNASYSRNLAKIPTGTIRYSDYRGKSSIVKVDFFVGGKQGDFTGVAGEKELGIIAPGGGSGDGYYHPGYISDPGDIYGIDTNTYVSFMGAAVGVTWGTDKIPLNTYVRIAYASTTPYNFVNIDGKDFSLAGQVFFPATAWIPFPIYELYIDTASHNVDLMGMRSWLEPRRGTIVPLYFH